jgi:hypothetical protein
MRSTRSAPIPRCCSSGSALDRAHLRAFEDYRLHAAELSGKALAMLRRMLAGEDVDQADRGLSAREWRELQAHLNGDGSRPSASARLVDMLES